LKLWKFILLLMAFFLFGGAAMVGVNFLLLPSLVHHNEVVTMPDIRGMTVRGADTKLVSLDLVVEISRQRSHPSIPEGMILDQIPPPEGQIRGGRTVRVITSSGPPAGALPDLTGLTLRQAEISLQRENYRLGRVVKIRRHGTTESTVEAMNPGPGVELYKGAEVDLVVAVTAAAQLLRMPDLRGEPLYRVRQIVADAGFVLAPVTYERTSDMAPNLVLAQNPPAGVRVREGEQLELVASSR
jgi:eukaryotic-like serine/threonine-protein kinase